MSGFAVFEGLGTVALNRCQSDLLFGKPIPRMYKVHNYMYIVHFIAIISLPNFKFERL